MIADRAKKKLQSGQFREGRSGYRKQELFFFWPEVKIKNGVILSKFDRESPKVNQVIFFSAPTSIPNMKALAQIRFEISCTPDYQNLFSKGHYSNKGHNTYMKKIQANYFFMRNLYMKFQNPSIHS